VILTLQHNLKQGLDEGYLRGCERAESWAHIEEPSNGPASRAFGWRIGADMAERKRQQSRLRRKAMLAPLLGLGASDCTTKEPKNKRWREAGCWCRGRGWGLSRGHRCWGDGRGTLSGRRHGAGGRQGVGQVRLEGKGRGRDEREENMLFNPPNYSLIKVCPILWDIIKEYQTS
jgi:hypothetical protein